MNDEIHNKKSSSILDSDFLRKLDQLAILSKKIMQGMIKGERRSKKKGVSIEFADYRNYSVGDDIRFIDWNVYGRLDKLFLKLFLEEEELFFYILIDSSKSMGFGDPRKFDYAVKLSAALAYIALSSMDRVGIGVFGEDLYQSLTPRRGKGHIWQMFEFLEHLSCDGKTSLSESAKKFVLKNKTRGVVVLISDLLDPAGFSDAFKWLGGGGFETYIIHLFSEDEITPNQTGHVELVDSETGEKIEITVNEAIMKNYNKSLNIFCEEAKNSCLKNGFVYIPSRTGIPVEQFILSYLKRRGLLK